MRGDILVPDTLRQGPFSIREAEAAGLTRHDLRRKSFRRVTRGVYVWAGLDAGVVTHLRGLAPRLPPGAAFSGVTAGLVYGFDLPPGGRREATLPHDANVTQRSDLHVRHADLGSGDVVDREGVPVTSPLRTAFDLARRLSLTEAVVQIDIALYRGLVSKLDLERYCEAHPRAAGIARARRAVDLAEVGAQSPMESRLRMLLVMRGLPRPVVQMPVWNRAGRIVAHADIGYPAARLGIEYDGREAHRDNLLVDDRRQNTVQLAGTLLLRFTSDDVRQRPDETADEVRAALIRPHIS